MKALNAINAQIQQRIANRDPAAYSAASVYAECMKLKHAVTLAESQGSEVLKGYLAKLIAEGTGAGGSKASQRLAQDPSFRELFERSTGWTTELHPKPGIALGLVKEQLETHPDSRIILFATYRDTVQLLVDFLAKNGIASERFVGQATKDAEKGLTQKKQIAALDRFRRRGVQGTDRHVGRGGRARRPVHGPGDLLRGGALGDTVHPAQGPDREVGGRTGRRDGDEGDLGRGVPPCQPGKGEDDA